MSKYRANMAGHDLLGKTAAQFRELALECARFAQWERWHAQELLRISLLLYCARCVLLTGSVSV
jgi:hypothetical protein